MSGWVPWKPSGVTPITVNAWVLSVMVEPTTSSRPPSRRCQKAWLTTTTGCPPGVRSSSGVSTRPRAAPTPMSSNKLPDTTWPQTRSAPSAVRSPSAPVPNAATPATPGMAASRRST